MRVCTVCQHRDKEAIDSAIIVGSAPVLRLAAQYGLTESALRRHAKSHLPETLRKAQDDREEAHALDVVKQLKAINAVAWETLQAARKAEDPEVTLKAMDRIQRQITLQAKLLGDLSDAPPVMVSPEWRRAREALLRALQPYPEARRAVLASLLELEGGE